VSTLVHRLKVAARWVRVVWVQAGLTILALVVIDSLAVVTLRSRSRIDSRAFADGYHGATWTIEYFDELAHQKTRWEPYVYWVGSRYAGRYINVDSQGIRRTTASRDFGCRRRSRVFTFGGSAMWGIGARDDETIASWLQKLLDARHACVEVINMGQDGYVSTQEVLLLAEQLRRGNTPDLVIFYDGYNDVLTAEYNNAAGFTYNEDARRREFNLSVSRRQLLTTGLKRLLLDTGIAEMARRMIVGLAPGVYSEVQGRLVAIGAAKVQTTRAASDDKLQHSVVDAYLLNKEFADAMATRFGFQTLTYWQPSVLDKNKLTPYERVVVQSTYLPGEIAFASALERRMRAAGARAGIHNLSGLFHDCRQPYFIDDVHVTGEANRVIAEAMVADVMASLEQAHPRQAAGAAATGTR